MNYNRRWRIIVNWAILLLPLACSSATVDPVPQTTILEQQPNRNNHPTKVTGFGSRSSLRHRSSSTSTTSSLLFNTNTDNNKNKSRPSLSRNSARPSQLWVQYHNDTLLFRCNNHDHDTYTIHNTDQHNNATVATNTTTVLAFSIDNGAWDLQKYDEHDIDNINSNNNSSALWLPVEGIYGVYAVPSGVIWVLISSSTSVLISSPWGEIRKVKSMEVIHVPSSRTTKEGLTQRQIKEQLRQLQLLRQALKSHEFYFARGGKMDMTQSVQRALLGRQPMAATEWTAWRNGTATPDSRFFWNEPALQPIMEKMNSDPSATHLLLDYCIPVTSAFVGVERNVSVNDQLSYDEVLISRRSRFRAGTRFTKRGADATGAVANYVETEQVCLVGNHTLLSHVQTRGSIPLRWSSPADVKTYRPRVRIGTDPVAQARALQNHVLSEWNTYVLETAPPAAAATPAKQPKFVLLNLIDKKKDQGRLGRAFDAVLRAVLDAHSTQSVNDVSSKSVEHIWFDFHAQVKGGRWHKLGKLLTQMSPTLADHGYFKACRNDNNNDWTIERLQTGVVRTNCMDCLDRTNVVQSIFGRYALFNELTGIVAPDDNSKKVLPHDMSKAFRMDALTLPWKSGEVHHRALWADNADAISRLYAGTPALKRDFTRTGRRTKLGALDDGINSLQRYYLNNFMDADRQEGVDLMVGHASFSILRDGEEPHDDAASKYAMLKRANMSLLQAARTLLDEQHQNDAAADKDGVEDQLNEASFVSIKRARKNILSQMGGPTLDLRWLPGDLQSHVKASANAGKLQDLDRRTASDTPWWVIEEDTTAEEKDDDRGGRDLQNPVNIGHVLGGLIAAIQAPVATASTILLILGCMQNDGGDS